MDDLKNKQSYSNEATCTKPETIRGVECLHFVVI